MLSDSTFSSVKDIHWTTQASTSESVLFYRLTDETKSESQFLERIKEAKFAHLILNKPLKSYPQAHIVPESEWPELQKKILDRLYPLPKLKFIALTGTNGKTTTTDLVLQLGSQMGKRGLSIGTLGVREVGKTLQDFGLTSPSYIDLRKFLHQYGQDKDFCVLEASSHALTQERLYKIEFNAAGWLSFSQDHLDYHSSLEDYFQAKCRLFDQLSHGAKLFVPSEQRELQDKLSQFSQTSVAPVLFEKLPIFFQTKFNKNNLEVAVAIIQEVFKKTYFFDFSSLLPPDGRFYIRPSGSNYIVVDFAHTPDALDNVCQAITEAFPHHKLKVLFGCGGDRDRSKRPQMAKIVSKWASEIYLTSDNPRSENPAQIIEDISRGVEGKPYKKITERPRAVNEAFEALKHNEVLLLAGKGHEDYILIQGVKHPYSDIQEVEKFLSRTRT
jgi:UDP-N-acetylmuramoyl-L-alanyl-D-glutamate--2,6-diaminopimelate ligase